MKTLVILLLLSIPLSGRAQDRLLEKKLTLSLQDETLENSLKKISVAGGFVFSYNPAIMEGKKRITHNFINQSLREILDTIFNGAIEYKTRGKYVILTAAAQSAAKPEPAIVTGYIVDEATGERLKDVSVYDPITLSSTITDSQGYFEIKIDKPAPEIILSVNRQHYTDTIVAVRSQGRSMNIPLRISKEKITVLADSVGEKFKRLWGRQSSIFRRNVNLMNVDDTLYRVAQLSLLPFVGTNHKMSGAVINDFSLNILGGYSLGVNALEIGGLFNLVRGNVRGAQVAGLFNGVGGEMEGFQVAGILNGNAGATRGAQVSGILNLNDEASRGVLFAGVGNIATGTLHGPQFAGVFNLSAETSSTAQFAGVFNINGKTLRGMQTAGVFNVSAGDMKGTQLAGVFNIAAKHVKGVQIASVFNVASRVKGVQIALVNVADSVGGIPIGLMSIVWKGYHKIEISADEIFYNNLSFRTGVRQFYNIFSVGAKPDSYKEDEVMWTFGYGLGTAPRLSKKWFLNLDITANQIIKGNTIEAINLLNKLYVGFDYQAFKMMSLTFGATLNGYVTDNTYDAYPPLFTDYQPNIILDRSIGTDHNLKMWVGAKVGLRFL